MERKIRVLIVDDESLARRGIRRLLEPETDFVIEAEASNGTAAAAAIERLNPDLVFLDIQMPLLDGLSLVDSLGSESIPEIVFITAYDEHAIQAFEAGAIDYLLKPVDPDRFKKTLDRVRHRIVSGGVGDLENRLREVLSSLRPPGQAYLTRIAVHNNERIRFLKAEEIDWIRSQGNYIEVHSKGNKFLIRETMSGIERKLDPAEFLRIRRSTIVRVENIKELQLLFNGEFSVVLKDGTELVTSRRYRKNLEPLLKT